MVVYVSYWGMEIQGNSRDGIQWNRIGSIYLDDKMCQIKCAFDSIHIRLLDCWIGVVIKKSISNIVFVSYDFDFVSFISAFSIYF